MNKFTRLLLLGICLITLSACGSKSSGSPVPAATDTGEAAATVGEGSVAVSTQAPASMPATDNGRIARNHLEALSATIGPRLPGTQEETQAAGYIQAAFEGLGYETRLQEFSFTAEDGDLNSANVIAIKAGASPTEIIVGAHYDSSDESNGADDNASGVAVMLEAAEMVKDVETPYTIRFIAFGAEENDLDGSRSFVQQMSAEDIENTIGMINLDSLIAGDIAYVYGDAGPGTLRDWILQAARDRGFELEARAARELNAPDGTPCDCADYGPFQNAGIPFAYFEATNWDLGNEDGMTQVGQEFGDQGAIRHTRYDTISYIDETFPGRIDHHLNLFVTLLVDTLVSFEI